MPDPAPHPGTPDDGFSKIRDESFAASIHLSGAERDLNGTTAMQIARGEHEMRRELATGILKIFVVGNAPLWVLVVALLSKLLSEGQRCRSASSWR